MRSQAKAAEFISPKLDSIADYYGQLWRYRGFLAFWVRREIETRYAGMRLGLLWIVAQPVLSAVVYFVIFAKVFAPHSHEGHPAWFFYLSAVVWGLFSRIFILACGIFHSFRDIYSKTYFPRMIILVGINVICLLDFVIQLAVFAVWVALCDPHAWIAFVGSVSGAWVFKFLTTVLQAVTLGSACGMVGAWFLIKLPDFKSLLPFVTQILMLSSAVVYPFARIPDSISRYFHWNPAAVTIEHFRNLILSGGAWSWADWQRVWLMSLILSAFGLFLFVKAEEALSEEL